MSGTNENLNPGPFEAPFDPSTADLSLFNEAHLKAFKRSIVLQQCNVENEIVCLQEAQDVRLAEFGLEWDNFEQEVAKRILEQEKKLEQMKKAQQRYVELRKEQLKQLKAEHKAANAVLVNGENFLKSSLQAITGALKSMATMRARKTLAEVQFTPDTWQDMD